MMSIRRDLLMRTALLRMPEVLAMARAAGTEPPPASPEAMVRPAAQPKRRRRTKPRVSAGQA